MKKQILSFIAFTATKWTKVGTSSQSLSSDDKLKALPSTTEMLRPFGEHDVKAFITPDRGHYP